MTSLVEDNWISIILGISIISFLADKSYQKCIDRISSKITRVNILVTLFLHHAIVTFAYLGWLSNNKFVLTIYLLLPLMILLHWKSNNYQCIFTQKINCECNENIGFHGLLENYDALRSVLGVGFYCIGLYKFFNLGTSI